MKSPRLTQTEAARDVARNDTRARDAGVERSSTTIAASVPPTTTRPDLPIGGKAKTSKSVPGWALVEAVITGATKSPSITIAAFGGPSKTCEIDCAKSVSSAPAVPPAMFVRSPRIFAVVLSAALTLGSVQRSLCSARRS